MKYFSEYEYINEADMDDIRGSLSERRETQGSTNRTTTTGASDEKLNSDGEATDKDEDGGSTAEEEQESQQSDGDEWSEEEFSVSRKTSGVPDNLPDITGIRLGENQRSTRRKASDGYEIPTPGPVRRESEPNVYIVPINGDRTQATC